MTLADVIEWLGDDHYKQAELMGAFEDVMENLMRYQDEESGLWYK